MNLADIQKLIDREKTKQEGFSCRVFCCASTPCLSSGATGVREAFKEAADTLEDVTVDTVSTGCMGPCSRGPVVTIRGADGKESTYAHVTPEMAKPLLNAHVS